MKIAESEGIMMVIAVSIIQVTENVVKGASFGAGFWWVWIVMTKIQGN